MRVAALYVETDGIYFGLPDVDPWDERRDARNYDGPHPVVAHPPCSTWCQLARLNETLYGHRVGDDGGCFEHALSAVRRFGGVLEHPAGSIAWAHFGLPMPMRHGWTRTLYAPREWVCEVSQRAYGHRAAKRTWLLAVTNVPPVLSWARPRPIATVSKLTNHGGGDLPRLSSREAKATPLAFRDALLSIARLSRGVLDV